MDSQSVFLISNITEKKMQMQKVERLGIIQDEIKKSGHWIFKFNQLIGYFPYTLSKYNSIQLTKVSLPYFLFILIQIIEIICWVNFVIYPPTFSSKNIFYSTAIEEFSYNLMRSCVPLTNFLIRALTICHAREFVIYYKSLNDILLDLILYDDFNRERECILKLKKIGKFKKRLIIIILSILAFIIAPNVYIFYEPIFTHYEAFYFYFHLCYADTTTIIHVFYPLLLCHLIELKCFAFESLGQLWEFDDQSVEINSKIMHFLNTFKKLEALMNDFNHNLFTFQLIFYLTTLIGLILSSLFFYIAWNQYYWVAWAYLPGICCNTTVLWLLCKSGSDLSFKTEQAISKTQDFISSADSIDINLKNQIQFFCLKRFSNPISMRAGNFFIISQKLLASLISATVGYLLVLLQFQFQKDKDKITASN